MISYEVKYNHFGDNPYYKYGKEIIEMEGKDQVEEVQKLFDKKHRSRYNIISIRIVRSRK